MLLGGKLQPLTNKISKIPPYSFAKIANLWIRHQVPPLHCVDLIGLMWGLTELILIKNLKQCGTGTERWLFVRKRQVLLCESPESPGRASRAGRGPGGALLTPLSDVRRGEADAFVVQLLMLFPYRHSPQCLLLIAIIFWKRKDWPFHQFFVRRIMSSSKPSSWLSSVRPVPPPHPEVLCGALFPMVSYEALWPEPPMSPP